MNDCETCSDLKQFRIGVILMIASSPIALIMLADTVCDYHITYGNTPCPGNTMPLPLWVTIPDIICGCLGLIFVFTTSDDKPKLGNDPQ